jgi:hypothetical protein
LAGAGGDKMNETFIKAIAIWLVELHTRAAYSKSTARKSILFMNVKTTWPVHEDLFVIQNNCVGFSTNNKTMLFSGW